MRAAKSWMVSGFRFASIRWTQKRYRDFVREGLSSRPWEELRGQIYLGSEEFVEEDSPKNLQLKEIPRAQLHAVKPSLERIFARQGERGIVRAYKKHGYRIREIAAHLEVHYATVSRRLKEMEQEE